MQYFLTSTGRADCYVRKDKFDQRLASARSFAPRTRVPAREPRPPPFSGRERPLGLEPDQRVLGEEGAPPEPDRPREPSRLHPPAQGLVANPNAGADLFD